jgi:hypothetical protein
MHPYGPPRPPKTSKIAGSLRSASPQLYIITVLARLTTPPPLLQSGAQPDEKTYCSYSIVCNPAGINWSLALSSIEMRDPAESLDPALRGWVGFGEGLHLKHSFCLVGKLTCPLVIPLFYLIIPFFNCDERCLDSEMIVLMSVVCYSVL